MLALTSKNIVPILGQFTSYNVTYQNHAPQCPPLNKVRKLRKWCDLRNKNKGSTHPLCIFVITKYDNNLSRHLLQKYYKYTLTDIALHCSIRIKIGP